MNTIEQMIQTLCPDGVKRVKLGEICQISTGKLNANAMVDGGAYPFFTCSDKIFQIDSYAFDCEALLVAGNGYLGNVKYYKGKFNAYQRTYVLNTFAIEISVMFLYYYIKAFFRDYALSAQNDASVPYITLGTLQSFEIPLPPLSIQAEIVKILDRFAVLTAELEAELEGRRKQYEYYRTRLLSFDSSSDTNAVRWMRLGDVATIGTGMHNTKDGLIEGAFPFYTRGIDVLRLNSFDFDETALITAGDGAGVGKVIHYISGKYALHQRAYRIVPNKDYLIPRFLYYYMRATFYDYIMGSSVSSSVTSIRMPMLMQYPIPIPSLSEQERIVNILDKFDQLVNGVKDSIPSLIDDVQKQYEFYRNKLLTFPE